MMAPWVVAATVNPCRRRRRYRASMGILPPAARLQGRSGDGDGALGAFFGHVFSSTAGIRSGGPIGRKGEVSVFFFGCASGGLEFKGGYISVGGDVRSLCVCRRGDNNKCRLSFSTKVSWGQLLLFLRNGFWALEDFG